MAWRKLLAVGLVGSAVAVGCTVNTTNNNIGGLEDGGTTGGSSNGGGGSSNGGKGGTANGGGGTANGGTDAGGGDVCKVETGESQCGTCIKTRCCDVYKACGADAACGQSSTDDGEFLKFRNCLVGQFTDAGTINVDDCAGQAAADGVALSFATRDLLDCIRGTADSGTQPCSETCFGTTLP